MKRPIIGLVLLVVLSACSSANTESPSPIRTTAPIVLRTAPPTSAPTATPAPRIADLALYPLPQADDLFRGARIASLAGSPSGAVILGTDVATGALISWTSADGDNWERHWLPGSTFGGGSPEFVVGGDFGFVASGWRFDGTTFVGALWRSTDGVSWDVVTGAGLPSGTIRALVAGQAGIAVGFDLGAEGAAAAVSKDARSWRVAALPPPAILNPGSLVAVPDGFLLSGSIQTVDAGGTSTYRSAAWRSSDGGAWSEDGALASNLAGLENSIEGWTQSPFGAVAWDLTMTGILRLGDAGFVHLPTPPTPNGHLVGGPAGLLWVDGSDLKGTCSAAWQFDGAGWVALTGSAPTTACVDAAEPFILGSAALPKGIVVFGLLGNDYRRVAWLVRPVGDPPTGAAAGGPVPTAPAASIPDPLAATFDHLSTCPSLPTSFATVFNLDPRLAAGCFGDRDLTFRAWVVDPGEGYGGTCGAFTPIWMRECVMPDYLLSDGAPIDPNSAGSGDLHAMRSPTATGDLKGVGRWVEVMGHYDDPISPTCRFSGDVGTIGFEPEQPPAAAVLICRLVFVVTHLRTVPAA